MQKIGFKPKFQKKNPIQNDPILSKLPPQSLEAEESILSSILSDKSALLEILEILRPEHFYKEAHKKIFKSIIEMFEKNEPTDLVTITNSLREKNTLESVGGAAYLSRLIDSIPMAPNVVHYAKIVRQKSVLRNLISKANAIMALCFESQGELDNVLDFAEKSIYEISQDKINPSFYTIKDVIHESFDILDKRSKNKAILSGVPTGFKELDKITSGFQNSDLIILAARPGMGKTAFSLNIARNACFNNIPVAFFSLEMSKEQLALRLLCSESRLNSEKTRSGFLEPEDWEGLTKAASNLTDLPLFIDDTPGVSSMEVRAKSRRLKKDHNLGLVIVDYLQLMRTSESAERRDLAIAQISSSLKSLAKELNIPVIALSQLNRKLEERGDKRPILSDLRESGSLEQDSDIVIFIYRDEIYNKDENNPNKGLADILIRKHRNGPTGKVTLKFQDSYTKFENYAPDNTFKT